jgi:hypothetical protein
MRERYEDVRLDIRLQLCFALPKHLYKSSIPFSRWSKWRRPKRNDHDMSRNGVAVSKKWLFAHWGRPVIYDRPEGLVALPDDQRYRFVPYDPTAGTDFTWERE